MSVQSDETRLAVMANDISYIKGEVIEIKLNQKSNYVTRAEFDPVKKVVYGLVGLALIGLVTSIINLVLKK